MSTRGQGRYYEEEPDPAGQHSTPSELFDMLLNAQRKRDAEHHTEEADTLYIANSKGEKIPLSPDMYAAAGNHSAGTAGTQSSHACATG